MSGRSNANIAAIGAASEDVGRGTIHRLPSPLERGRRAGPIAAGPTPKVAQSHAAPADPDGDDPGPTAA